MKNIVYILLCLLLSVNFLMAKEFQSRVTGGEKATSIEGREYLVSVMTKHLELYSSSCGGTLISPTYVVTAAHCVMDKDMYVFANHHILPDDQQAKAAMAGTTLPSIIGDVSLVERVFYYSDYAENSNDIAILRLETPIVIPKYASLPSAGQTMSLISSNTKMDLAGWGLTSAFPSGAIKQGDIPDGAIIQGTPPPKGSVGQESPEGGVAGNGFLAARDLHTVLTTPLSTEQCKSEELGGKKNPSTKEIAFIDNMLKKVICAGGKVVNEPNKGACRGDSGGPLVYKNGEDITLIGIVSRGSSAQCIGFKSSQYTKVEAFLSFIDEAKKGTFQSDGILRKGYIKDLPKGWSLIGTEKTITNNTKLFTSDIGNVYFYDSKLSKWVIYKITNGTPPDNFNIPGKSGFWVDKP